LELTQFLGAFEDQHRKRLEHKFKVGAVVVAISSGKAVVVALHEASDNGCIALLSTCCCCLTTSLQVALAGDNPLGLSLKDTDGMIVAILSLKHLRFAPDVPC